MPAHNPRNRIVTLLVLLPILTVVITGCTTEPERDLAGTLRWSLLIGSEIHSAPAISPDGTIVITARDEQVYSISPFGQILWQQGAGVPLFSSPVIGGDGSIYVGSGDGSMLAWTEDGVPEFVYGAPGGFYTTAPAISSEGTLFYGQGFSGTTLDWGVFFALEPGYWLNWYIGAWDWSAKLSPVISDDGEYILPYGYGVEGINPANGERSWTYTIESEVTSHSPAIDSDGIIYFGAKDGLHALTASGELFWHYEMDVEEVFSPVTGVDGTIYVSTRDLNENQHPALFAINADGTLKWSYTSYNGASPPVVGSNGTIYWPTTKNRLLALSETGELDWMYLLSGRAEWSSEAPSLGPDGTLYMGTTTGVLLAIRTNSQGLANSSWPRFRGNNQADGRKR
ncbi:PQQ-binding-like beta-propeller repeat protein [Gemmatimonadota bacterium]